jgi:Tfp pilus assembly protein PilF
VISRDPDNADAHIKLASVLDKLGRDREVDEELRIAMMLKARNL